MHTTIVSGFGPWGEIDENPTALVLDRLAARGRVDELVALPLPVDTHRVASLVDAALVAHRPALWIGLGLAVGSAVVAVERIAANIRDFDEPDVSGAQPLEQVVVAGGPAAYLATWPTLAILRRLRQEGVPARASSTAGTFLCNQLMYRVLHEVAARGLPTRVGFLHVPAHPALVARRSGKAAEQPSMDLELVTRAVEWAAEVARTALPAA